MPIKLQLTTNLSGLESAIRKDFPNYSLVKKKYYARGCFSRVRKVVDENKNTVAVVKTPWVYIDWLYNSKQTVENFINHTEKDAKKCKELEKTNRVPKVYGIYPFEMKVNKELISDAEIIRDIAGTFTNSRWGRDIPPRENIIDDVINMLQELKILLTQTFNGSVALKEFIKGFSISKAKQEKILTKEEFTKEFLGLFETLKSCGIGSIDNIASNCLIDVNDGNRLKTIEMGSFGLLGTLNDMDKEAIREQAKSTVQWIIQMYQHAWGEEPDTNTKERIKEIYTT